LVDFAVAEVDVDDTRPPEPVAVLVDVTDAIDAFDASEVKRIIEVAVEFEAKSLATDRSLSSALVVAMEPLKNALSVVVAM
jgi:hypothetical protein